MYRLVFQSGRHEGKRIVVRQALTVAGRDPGCHLVLDGDERMAPRHASLEERGTGIYLSPLSPDHAVRRNGDPVTGAVRLAHNDEIDLGGIRLVFQELIAPQARLRPSTGLMQPVTILAAAAILAVEVLLLAYLVDWPAHLLRPAIESADLAFAEAHRAAREAEAQALAKQKAETPAGADSIVSLPGTASASTSAPPVAVSTGPAPAVASAPEEILQVLEVADFPPADTNTTLVDLPPVSAADPRIEEAQRLLAQAVAAADFADYAGAYRILDQIHQLEPGFLPAHVEHARLLEARGDLDAARQRWGVLLGLAAPDSPFRRQAQEQTRRLDDLRALQTRLIQSPAPMDPDRLPRGIRLVSADIQRLPADADVAEMRILNGAVEVSPEERLFQDALVQVFVTFYDHAPDQEPRPTRAITTPSPIVLGAVSRLRPGTAFEATYVVPQGARNVEARTGGTPLSYYGYTIHVFAGQILQDAVGKPRKLLNLPIHFPDPAQD